MNDWTPEPDRVRLLADRLCYLKEGIEGLRRRHGLFRSGLGFRDQYDHEATRLAPTLLKPRPVFQPPEPPGWKQPTLFGG